MRGVFMKKLLLLLTVLLVGCSKNTEQPVTKIYDYKDVEDTCSWADVFKQEEEEYLVYFYSLTCGHCLEIKQEMISYYLSKTEKIYFSKVDETTVFGPKGELKGIDSIEKFYIFGTPFLVKLKKWVVIDYFAGTKSILEYINYKN